MTKKEILKKQYKKERNRIQSATSRYTRQGFLVETPLPPIPKNITQASINKLKKITTAKIRSELIKVDYETGEIIGYTRSKREEREIKRKQKKIREDFDNTTVKSDSNYDIAGNAQKNSLPNFSDIIISNFSSQMSLFNESAIELINTWLSNLIAQEGKDFVADMLQEAANKGLLPDFKVVYNRELLLNNLAQMMNLMDMTYTGKQDFIESLEYEESFEIV